MARPVVALAAAVLFALLVLAGCGDAVSEVPENPFGDPPAPAPGVHAWAAGEAGVVLTTADGGATWRRQRFFLPQRGVDVAFSDVSNGWLVTDAGTVLTTNDAGAGWTVVEQVELTAKAIAASGAGRPGSPPSSVPSTVARPGVRRGSVWRNSPTSPSPMSAMACSSRSTGSGPRATAAGPGSSARRSR
jgi:hypothetical protein